MSAKTTRGLRAHGALAPRGLVVVALASAGCIPAGLTLASNGGDASDATVETSACPDDSCCDSGNPGACATGELIVDGGVAACVALASTQPCYTAEAGTNGVGACHAGTQSCVGSLGPCSGEVTPAPIENCFNSIDDDCDGVVNDGCPSALSLGPDRSLSGAGGDGGGPRSAHCPPESFITRVDSWGDATSHHASGVSIYCATPTLVQGSSTYSVTLTPVSPAPYAQLVGLQSASDNRKDDCGLTGLTAITYTVGLADIYVEALGNHCATSPVTLQADNTLTFDFTGSGDKTYTAWGDAGAAFDETCKPNEVVVGFDVRDGNWLNSITPICAALTVVPM